MLTINKLFNKKPGRIETILFSNSFCILSCAVNFINNEIYYKISWRRRDEKFLTFGTISEAISKWNQIFHRVSKPLYFFIKKDGDSTYYNIFGIPHIRRVNGNKFVEFSVDRSGVGESMLVNVCEMSHMIFDGKTTYFHEGEKS